MVKPLKKLAKVGALYNFVSSVKAPKFKFDFKGVYLFRSNHSNFNGARIM